MGARDDDFRFAPEGGITKVDDETFILTDAFGNKKTVNRHEATEMLAMMLRQDRQTDKW